MKIRSVFACALTCLLASGAIWVAGCSGATAESVTLNKTELEFAVGDSETLIAEVLPADGDYVVSWTSSDDDVSTVSNGTVTAIGAGTAVITAKAGGKSATCTVTVMDKAEIVSEYTLADFGLNETPARIDIDTFDGNPIPGDGRNQPYVDCTVSVEGYGSGTDFADVAAEVRIRGNNTAGYDKKPYRIKFNSKRNLLGLNEGAECKSWVLLACYKDVTYLRDALAFEFGNITLAQDGYFVSDYAYAELYINGTYNGFYMVAEQQQVNKNRVDIYEPEEGYEGTDIGYLIEYDGNAPMTEERGHWFELDYSAYPMRMEDGSSFCPTQDDYYTHSDRATYTVKNDMYGTDPRNTAQLAFAQKYTENVFEILYKAMVNEQYYAFDADYNVVPSTLTSSRAVVESVVNLDSWVDMFLLQEFCRDNDVDWSSFFFSVDMSEGGDKKLTFEAPWDFDNGFGMKEGMEDGTGFACANNDTTMRGLNPWLALCYQSDWFMGLAAERWEQLVADGLYERMTTLIDVVTEGYVGYFEKNYNLWDNLNKVCDPVQNPDIVSSFNTHADAAAYLKGWVNKRIAWLTDAFSQY